MTYKQGDTFLVVTVAIPKRIDRAARERDADYSLRVIVSYVSAGGTPESAESGPVPIRDTTFVQDIDKHTVAVTFQVPLGTAPPPGASPSFNATVELLRNPSGHEDDDDLDD